MLQLREQMKYLEDLGVRARAAQTELAVSDVKKRNSALRFAAKILRENTETILIENNKDINAARSGGLTDAMIERLTLSEDRISSMANALEKCAEFADPVGKILSETTRPNGLLIRKITVPLGVIGVIYESRPNVTSDAAALCIKSGNVCILKGGKEAFNSNLAIVKCLREGLLCADLPADCILFIDKTDRKTTGELMRLDEYVDVLIPRGGHNLIAATVKNSTIPVIKTGEGNCHVYIDEFADVDKAVKIVVNAKTSRVSVCNACESLVVHSKILPKAMEKIAAALAEKNVKMYCDDRSLPYCIGGQRATTDDFATEYLDYAISVKTVDSIDEAIEHIERYSTKHSEAIVTENDENAKKFTEKISSCAVYVNASTRFTDGEEFGFGAEIGISTGRLHARGPVGLNELETYKYVVVGDGQVR